MNICIFFFFFFWIGKRKDEEMLVIIWVGLEAAETKKKKTGRRKAQIILWILHRWLYKLLSNSESIYMGHTIASANFAFSFFGLLITVSKRGHLEIFYFYFFFGNFNPKTTLTFLFPLFFSSSSSLKRNRFDWFVHWMLPYFIRRPLL